MLMQSSVLTLLVWRLELVRLTRFITVYSVSAALKYLYSTHLIGHTWIRLYSETVHQTLMQVMMLSICLKGHYIENQTLILFTILTR